MDLHPSYSPLLPLLSQAAADFAKTHLPEALRQQLLIYARERERDRDKDREKAERKERSGLSYPSILEQQILNVDREMLDKLSASYNEAGMRVFIRNPASIVVQSSWCSSGSVKCRGVDAHKTLKAMLLWGMALNRCFRWRLKTRDMVVAPPSAAGTHMETHQVSTCTVSIPPLCRHPAVSLFAFFPGVLLSRGRQQPRERAYSAV